MLALYCLRGTWTRFLPQVSGQTDRADGRETAAKAIHLRREGSGLVEAPTRRETSTGWLDEYGVQPIDGRRSSGRVCSVPNLSGRGEPARCPFPLGRDPLHAEPTHFLRFVLRLLGVCSPQGFVAFLFLAIHKFSMVTPCLPFAHLSGYKPRDVRSRPRATDAENVG